MGCKFSGSSGNLVAQSLGLNSQIPKRESHPHSKDLYRPRDRRAVGTSETSEETLLSFWSATKFDKEPIFLLASKQHEPLKIGSKVHY